MSDLIVYFIWKYLTKYREIIPEFKMIGIKARSSSKKLANIKSRGARNNDFNTRMTSP